MPRRVHSQPPSAGLAVVCALVVLLVGCGGLVDTGRQSSERTELTYGKRPDPIHDAELHSAASAAWSFARAYAAAPDENGRIPATSSVLRQLRSLKVRLGGGAVRPAPRTVALALYPRTRREVDATVALKKSGTAYPINFVLHRIRARWLVAALPGN